MILSDYQESPTRVNVLRVRGHALLPGKGEVIGLMATGFVLAPGAWKEAAHVRL